MERLARVPLLAPLVLFGSLLAPFDGRALGLLADDREVFSHVRSRNAETGEVIELSEALAPDAPFAPFDGAAQQAEQQSSMVLSDDGRTMTWVASGEAEGFNLDEFPLHSAGNGRTTFSIRFRVDGQATVDLSGLLQANWGGYASPILVLSSGDDTLYSVSDQYSMLPLSFQALLPAGEYRFLVEAASAGLDTGGGASVRGAFSLNFVVTDTVPIPEPATLSLLALGLGALHGRGRRRAVVE